MSLRSLCIVIGFNYLFCLFLSCYRIYIHTLFARSQPSSLRHPRAGNIHIMILTIDQFNPYLLAMQQADSQLQRCLPICWFILYYLLTMKHADFLAPLLLACLLDYSQCVGQNLEMLISKSLTYITCLLASLTISISMQWVYVASIITIYKFA